MILNQDEALILVIDVQEKLVNAIFNKDIVRRRVVSLAKAGNILSLPTIVTEQYPKGLGETIPEVKEALGKDTVFFEKTSFSALSGTDLLSKLLEIGRKQVIIFGIETHICVHQTVIDLIKNGFDVTVVGDACGSRTAFEYMGALDVMKTNGAKIKTTEMVLFELLKGAKHPNFKEIQALIK
jgi:nicotinamidase-related amidase